MKKTTDYLDKLLELHKKDVKNDSQLAQLIGISRQAISQYRSGQNMNTYVCVKVAFLLNINPLETIAASMYEQSTNEEEKKFWFECYNKFKKALH